MTETIIDIHEALIDVRGLCGHPIFVSPRTGKPCHFSKVYRAITQGVKDANGNRVKLPVVRVPGGVRSSKEALEQFIASLTNPAASEADSQPRTPVSRQRDQQRADKQLVAAGW